VVVERNSPTKAGDIVVAIVDGEMTVKTLRLTKQGASSWKLPIGLRTIHPKGSWKSSALSSDRSKKTDDDR